MARWPALSLVVLFAFALTLGPAMGQAGPGNTTAPPPEMYLPVDLLVMLFVGGLVLGTAGGYFLGRHARQSASKSDAKRGAAKEPQGKKGD